MTSLVNGPMSTGPVAHAFSAYPPLNEDAMPPPPPGVTMVVQQHRGWTTPSPPATTPSPGLSPEIVDSMWPALSPDPVVPSKGPTPTNERPPTSSSNQVRVTINYFSPPTTPPPGQFYSCKVFVGGLADDVFQGSRSSIQYMRFFEQFGGVRIEFPPRRPVHPINRPMRYLHVLYFREESVRYLLNVCQRDAGGRYFLQLSPGTQVNVRPFIVLDGRFRADGVSDVDHHVNSVLMTNVPRHYPASKLAYYASLRFGPVSAVDIRLDRHFYPMGSAIVTFANHVTYIRAVYSKVFELQDYFRSWEVNIQPYAMFDRECEKCGDLPGSHFCRNVSCLHYFCEPCFTAEHDDFPHPGEESPDVLIYNSEESCPAVRVSRENQNTTVSVAAENNSDGASSDVSV